MSEYLLQPEEKRYSVFPIKHHDLWKFYKDAFSAMWVADEIDFSEDKFDNLTADEQHFIKHVLGFFAASDIIVNDNLMENFLNEVQVTEALFFYGYQVANEQVHSETYGLMIDEFIKDEKEKHMMFNAISELPAVKKKAEWALKWIESPNFAERLVAFACVEGIHFSGSFCSIFWLKSRGLMPGLCESNALISRDEGLHCDFAVYLHNKYVTNKVPKDRIKEIVLSALEVEKEFITESLPVSLIGMNNTLMKQYLEYVADQLLIELECEPVFNATQPFEFMNKIALEPKSNFFERRSFEYKKADMSDGIKFDSDF